METLDIRQAQIKDALHFEEQLSAEELAFMNTFYNHPNLLRAIESSCLAFAIYNDQDAVDGLAIFDYEPLNAAHLADDCYQLLAAADPDLTPFNTLFLSFLVLRSADEEQYQRAFERVALRVFAESSNVDTIVFLDEKNDAEATAALRRPLRQFLNNSRTWRGLGPFKAFRKDQVVPALSFRKAREEDQDDLAVVCNAQTNLTTAAFGDFFIAEMISSEKEETLCLVAETAEKKAVGLAVVSAELDYGVLVENFELAEHSYCIKSDFYEAYQHQREQLAALHAMQKRHQAQKYREELAFFKTVCSKHWLMLEIQEFCAANRAAFVGEFQPILNDPEKQKTLNKSILRRKLDKLLKTHRISAPNEVFARELDHEVSTCTMSATDLLLETLRLFDLPAGYLDGEGHWSFWLKRKQDERNEEARQKDILGKKKAKPKKNKFSDNKENQLTTPQWFDIEPFFVAFQNFAASHALTRKRVSEIVAGGRQQLLALFCAENGELLEGRAVDLSDAIEFLAAQSEGQVDEAFQQVMTHVLLCFGSLEFDQEVVILHEQLKSKSGKTKEKSTQRTLRKVSFHELMAAAEHIAANERILAGRHGYLDAIAQACERRFIAEAERFLAATRRDFATSAHFPSDFPLSLAQEIAAESSLAAVPEELKNALCWNIFFVDKSFEESSREFLVHIFEHFPDREYLLITLPHSTPPFKLLEDFASVRPKSSSNFSHALYLFHKANVLNGLAAVELVASKELRACLSSARDAPSEQRVTQLDFRVVLRAQRAEQADMLLGRLRAVKSLNVPFVRQRYALADFAFPDAFGKNEVLEVREFELHALFKSLERFVLREALRLSRCRLLVKDQRNDGLQEVRGHFFALRKLAPPSLVLSAGNQLVLSEAEFAVRCASNTANFEKAPVRGRPGRADGAPDLSATMPRLLTLKRQRVDARVVVLGASSCALSFIERLLDSRAFHFSAITLVSETFDWEPHVIEAKARKVEHAHGAYCVQALLNRIAVVCGKMVCLDRKTSRISVRAFSGAEFQLEYDFLVFANSLEEKTYENVSERKSQGELLKRPKLMFAVDKLNTDLCESLCANQKLPLFVDINQGFGARAQPAKVAPDFTKTTHEYSEVRELLVAEEDILDVFRGRKNWFERITQLKSPMQVVLYGFSAEILVVLEQLLNRWKVLPSNITLVIPRKLDALDKEGVEAHWPTFEQRAEFFEKITETPAGISQHTVREHYLDKLAQQGVCILRDYEISDFSYSENTVTLTTTHAAAREKGSNSNKRKPSRFASNLSASRNFDKSVVLPSNGPSPMYTSHVFPSHGNDSPHDNPEGEEVVFENCLFITGDFYDISHQTFRTIQENGLVYNGRLIVQSNFQTIDEKIFGAGKICEFSQRYNGLALGRSLRMDKYNQKEIGQKLASCFMTRLTGAEQAEELPAFSQPIGMSAFLAFGYFIIELEVPFQGKIDFGNALKYEFNDLLAEPEEEFVSLGFDRFGILKRFFYFGRKSLQMEAVNNLIGLHRNYFNNFFTHNENGLVRSFVDFMNEGWAKAIFHPSFPMFKQLMAKFATGERNDCSVDFGSPESTRLIIEEGLMDFVMEHKDLLQYYYVPEFKTRLE